MILPSTSLLNIFQKVVQANVDPLQWHLFLYQNVRRLTPLLESAMLLLLAGLFNLAYKLKQSLFVQMSLMFSLTAGLALLIFNLFLSEAKMVLLLESYIYN